MCGVYLSFLSLYLSSPHPPLMCRLANRLPIGWLASLPFFSCYFPSFLGCHRLVLSRFKSFENMLSVFDYYWMAEPMQGKASRLNVLKGLSQSSTQHLRFLCCIKTVAPTTWCVFDTWHLSIREIYKDVRKKCKRMVKVMPWLM